MIALGLTAGAVGTAALDLATYVDMSARGRPASELPATVVGKLAERVGLGSFANASDEPTQNRRQAIGALLGYAVGLGGGVAYAALRPSFRGWLPWPVAGIILGAATLVASEGSATALGATDWRTWSAADWIADMVPRSLYGLAVAATVEAVLDARREPMVEGGLLVGTVTSESVIGDGAVGTGLLDDAEIDADRDAASRGTVRGVDGGSMDGVYAPTIVDEERVI